MVKEVSASRWSRFWQLLSVAPRALRYKIAKDQVGLYSCICEEFLKLGGIYVKFLQGVLLQSDVMKNWEGKNKYKVFESVPVVPIDTHQLIEQQLKQPLDKVFSYVNKKPFATGSFGQVYEATLLNGNKVIIKILRPHIRKILKFDLRLLSIIAKLFTSDFTSLDVSLSKAVRDFKVMTMREVDYITEAQFAQEMTTVFQNDPIIYIPHTYQELCTEQMIVQDFVPGISVAEVLKESQTTGKTAAEVTYKYVQSDIRIQLQYLATEVLYNFFIHPKMPGDLHPGNVKLLPNNRVGIVDFGISARQPKTPNIFYTLLSQLTHVQDDGSTAGQMFVTYIKYFSYDLYLAFDRINRQFSDRQNLTELITDYAQNIFNKQTNSNFRVADIKYSTMFGAYVNQTVNEGNRFCIVTKVTEVELLRAVQTIVALIDSLELRELIANIFEEVYQRVTKNLPQFTREPANPLSLHEAVTSMDAWLGRLALKNPELFLKIKFFMASQKKIAN